MTPTATVAPSPREWGAAHGWPDVAGKRGRLPRELLAAFAEAFPGERSTGLVAQPVDPRMPSAYSCRCGNTWQGLRPCCCPSCHRLFLSVAGFDKHRDRGSCLDPTSLGMVPLSRTTWGSAWGQPDERWG